MQKHCIKVLNDNRDALKQDGTFANICILTTQLRKNSNIFNCNRLKYICRRQRQVFFIVPLCRYISRSASICSCSVDIRSSKWAHNCTIMSQSSGIKVVAHLDALCLVYQVQMAL